MITERPPECGVYDQEQLGDNATQLDLHRWWTAFDKIYHSRFMLEDMGINTDNPEEVGDYIDEWLYGDGDWDEQTSRIIGDKE